LACLGKIYRELEDEGLVCHDCSIFCVVSYITLRLKNDGFIHLFLGDVWEEECSSPTLLVGLEKNIVGFSWSYTPENKHNL